MQTELSKEQESKIESMKDMDTQRLIEKKVN